MTISLNGRAARISPIALLLPLALALGACTGAGAPPPVGPTPASPVRASDGTPKGGAALGAPAGTTEQGVAPAPGGVAGGAVTGTGSARGAGGSTVGTATSPNAAIAYPYPGFGGVSGVAADHTIVVTGVGLATVNADLSDRAAAQRTALTAALADAKAQADLVAKATGVSISGVLSVSVSGGGSYIYPVAMGAEGAAPGAASGGTTVPPQPGVVGPVAQQLEVSVTIAYQIG